MFFTSRRVDYGHLPNSLDVLTFEQVPLLPTRHFRVVSLLFSRISQQATTDGDLSRRLMSHDSDSEIRVRDASSRCLIVYKCHLTLEEYAHADNDIYMSAVWCTVHCLYTDCTRSGPAWTQVTTKLALESVQVSVAVIHALRLTAADINHV